jgi:quercetin dioxygenase-like cupin family protein
MHEANGVGSRISVLVGEAAASPTVNLAAASGAPALQCVGAGARTNGLQFAHGIGFLGAMRIVISTVIATFSFIVWTTSVSAQDPAVVNSKTIKIKFENERVRVLEAELPPGVKEQVHSHPAYVIYVQTGGKVRTYADDGKTNETELKDGEVLYRDPLTHAAENIGTTTMHMILVELKAGASETLKTETLKR